MFIVHRIDHYYKNLTGFKNPLGLIGKLNTTGFSQNLKILLVTRNDEIQK